MDTLHKDPVMLLSVVNTNLRDFYGSLDDFCRAKDVDKSEIEEKLEKINYSYDATSNQFVLNIMVSLIKPR